MALVIADQCVGYARLQRGFQNTVVAWLQAPDFA